MIIKGVKTIMAFKNGNYAPTERKLLPQAEEIKASLEKFGCIHFNQLEYFMPPYKSIRENYHISIANHLNTNFMAHIYEDCLVTRDRVEVDKGIVDTVWVMLDLLKDTEDTYMALKTTYKSIDPCTMTLIKDNAVKYTMLPISSKNEFRKISEVNRIYSNIPRDEKESVKIQYLIILRDLDLASELAVERPEFPFRVAFLEGEYGSMPDVSYYDIEV